MMEGFAEQYHSLRKLEGRFYTDEQVANLPSVPKAHRHHQEWKIREMGARQVLKLIAQSGKSAPKVLDLGCGNGWFAAMLEIEAKAEVLAIDVPGEELEQAKRVWKAQGMKIDFRGGDIFNLPIAADSLDFVTIGAAYQYFPDLSQLILRLRTLLKKDGVIIVFDSPVYPASACENAKARTLNYYQQMGFPLLAEFYHHHSWGAVAALGGKIALPAPGKWQRRWANLVSKPINPFPVLIFSKSQ